MRIQNAILRATDGRSLYRAAKVICADHPELKEGTVRERLRVWASDDHPEIFDNIDLYLRSLGYELALVEKGTKNLVE